MPTIPDEFLQDIADRHRVSSREYEVLAKSLHGESTQAIALQLGVTEQLVRKRLSDIYKKFQVPGRGPVKLQKLKAMLGSLYQSQLVSSDRPKATSFYDRAEEIGILSDWILHGDCRLVAVAGMRGIGKTELAKKLYDELALTRGFELLAWESLRYRPPLTGFLDRILVKLGSPDRSTDTTRKLERLLELLASRRCLLFVDRVDAILEDGQIVGRYRPGYEAYGELFRGIGEEAHRSCMIVCSRVKLPEIDALADPKSAVRVLRLRGLSHAAAKQLLASRDLHVEPEDEPKLTELIDRYNGHPQQLKFIRNYILEAFNGNISAFLKYNESALIEDISEALRSQLQNLSDMEKRIVDMLATTDNSVALSELANRFQSPEVWPAIQSLQRRSLLEPDEENQGFVLQNPLIGEYVRANRHAFQPDLP